MGTHRAQARFERARWRMLYLIPLWSMQLVLSILLLGLFSRRLGISARSYGENLGKLPVITIVWESINIAMSIAMAVCTAIEIAKFYAETLAPQTMILTNIIKAFSAVLMLTFDMIVYVQHRDQHYYSALGLAVDIILLVSASALIVYAIVAYRRIAAYDAYSHPANVNVKGYGFSDGLSYYSDGSCSSMLGLRSSVEKPARASFGSIGGAATRASVEQQQQNQHHTQQHQQQQRGLLASSPPEPMYQTSSSRYSHERSTKFEEYMSLYGPLHHRSEQDTAYRSQTQGQNFGGGFKDTKTVGRPRGASTGSRSTKSVSGEQVLRAVPEEDSDGVDAGAAAEAAASSTDGAGSDGSTASVPLMSSNEHDEFIVVKEKRTTTD